MSLTPEKIKQFKKEYQDLNLLRETLLALSKKGRKTKEERDLFFDLSAYRLNYCKYGGLAFQKPLKNLDEEE